MPEIPEATVEAAADATFRGFTDEQKRELIAKMLRSCEHKPGTHDEMVAHQAARHLIYHAVEMIRALEAAREHGGGWRVPEGWRLVPIEPTEEMMAAVDCAGDFRTAFSGRAWITGWRAMYNAAPLPPAPQDGSGR